MTETDLSTTSLEKEEGAICHHSGRQSTLWSLLQWSTFGSIQFILCNVDPDQARYLATSLMHIYYAICSQLPDAAAQKVRSTLEAYIKRSDSEFLSLWCSLVDNDIKPSPTPLVQLSKQMKNIEDERIRNEVDSDFLAHHHMPSFIGRLYHALSWGMRTLITNGPLGIFTSRTPVTSPQQELNGDEVHEEELDVDGIKIGWAVEYFERKSNMPWSIERKMRRTMHYSVPVNCFYAKVHFTNYDSGSDICSGIMSPDSFPPTPIAREYHSRQLKVYTTSVLDRTHEVLLHTFQHNTISGKKY